MTDVLAHGVGSRTDLPIPGGLALYGGGFAILASFAVLLLVWRRPLLGDASSGRAVPAWLQRAADSAAVRTAVQAGALAHARVTLENAGAAAWRDLNVSYHWLDDRGNPIVWDGTRHPITAAPGERVERDVDVRGPIPPGR